MNKKDYDSILFPVISDKSQTNNKMNNYMKARKVDVKDYNDLNINDSNKILINEKINKKSKIEKMRRIAEILSSQKNNNNDKDLKLNTIGMNYSKNEFNNSAVKSQNFNSNYTKTYGVNNENDNKLNSSKRLNHIEFKDNSICNSGNMIKLASIIKNTSYCNDKDIKEVLKQTKTSSKHITMTNNNAKNQLISSTYIADNKISSLSFNNISKETLNNKGYYLGSGNKLEDINKSKLKINTFSKSTSKMRSKTFRIKIENKNNMYNEANKYNNNDNNSSQFKINHNDGNLQKINNNNNSIIKEKKKKYQDIQYLNSPQNNVTIINAKNNINTQNKKTSKYFKIQNVFNSPKAYKNTNIIQTKITNDINNNNKTNNIYNTSRTHGKTFQKIIVKKNIDEVYVNIKVKESTINRMKNNESFYNYNNNKTELVNPYNNTNTNSNKNSINRNDYFNINDRNENSTSKHNSFSNIHHSLTTSSCYSQFKTSNNFYPTLDFQHHSSSVENLVLKNNISNHLSSLYNSSLKDHMYKNNVNPFTNSMYLAMTNFDNNIKYFTSYPRFYLPKA